MDQVLWDMKLEVMPPIALARLGKYDSEVLSLSVVIDEMESLYQIERKKLSWHKTRSLRHTIRKEKNVLRGLKKERLRFVRNYIPGVPNRIPSTTQ